MAAKKKKAAARRGRPPGRANKVSPAEEAKRRIRIQAIAEFAMAGQPPADIAATLRVSKATIVKAMASERFKELLDQCLEERRTAVAHKMESLAVKALDVHEDIMDDKAHRQRLAAAEGVLDRVGATQKGSLVRNEVKQVADDFQGRPEADLEYYVEHGCWPEDDPNNDTPKKKT